MEMMEAQRNGATRSEGHLDNSFWKSCISRLTPTWGQIPEQGLSQNLRASGKISIVHMLALCNPSPSDAQTTGLGPTGSNWDLLQK